MISVLSFFLFSLSLCSDCDLGKEESWEEARKEEDKTVLVITEQK